MNTLSGPNEKADVYFCHHDNPGDQHQVERLTVQLEKRGLKCLHSARDFLGGVPKVTNHLNCHEQSKWTVLVLSESFWNCKQCEFKMHQVIYNGGQKIIPVVLDDCAIPIEISHITPLYVRHEEFLDRFILTIFSDSGDNGKTVVSRICKDTSVKHSKRKKFNCVHSRNMLHMCGHSLQGPVLQPAAFTKLTGILKTEEAISQFRLLNHLTQFGMWSQLNEMYKALFKQKITKYTDVVIEEIVLHAIAACMRMDFRMAERLLLRGRCLLPKAENRELLEARLYYLEAYKYRKQNERIISMELFKKAYNMMITTEPCMILGVLVFHMASLRHEMFLNGQLDSADNDCDIQDIAVQFNDAIEIMKNEDPRLTQNLKECAITRLASFAVDYSYACDKKLNTPEEQVDEAHNILQKLKECGPRSVSKFAECCRLLVEAKCYHKLGQHTTDVLLAKYYYTQSVLTASDAISMANKYGFRYKMSMITGFMSDVSKSLKMLELRVVA